MSRRMAVTRFAACASALLLSAGVVRAQQFPSHPPLNPAPTALTLPSIYHTTLANGLEVVTVEDHRASLVSIALAVPAGTAEDPPGKEGTAQLAATLLTKGTSNRSADSIAAEIEGIGGTLSSTVGSDFFSVNATVLAEGLTQTTRLIGDMVLRATYPANELALARARERSAVAYRRAQPAARAHDAMAARVYDDHPYGRQESGRSVGAITRDDVVAWARTHLAPRGALLVFAGDVTPARARALAEEALGSWSGLAARTQTRPPPQRPTRILLIDRPGDDHATIAIGNLAIPASDPAFDAATLAVTLLGGGPDSRLFHRLRQASAWAYDVRARLAPALDVGTFETDLDAPARVADSAIDVVLSEMRRMRSDDVSDSDLARTKREMTQSFPLEIETAQDVASHISTAEELGLGKQYVETYLARIRALDAAQVHAAAQRILQPDSAQIVVVGDAATLYTGLRALAPVDIVNVDGESMTPAYVLARGRSAVDTSVLHAYADSLRIVGTHGRVVGTVHWSLARTDSGFVYRRRDSITPSHVERRTTALLATGTFDLLAAERSDSFPGGSQQTRLEVSRGSLHGVEVRASPRGTDTVTVDTAFAPGTVMVSLLDAYLPALPLSPGARLSLTMFDASDRSTSQATVAVSNATRVTVPAGTFEAYPVQVTGAASETTYYVTTVAPRRIVAADVPGQGFRLELVGSSEWP